MALRSGWQTAGDPTRRDRKHTEPELELTSLIDVVFLLLIFFMVTSTMTSQSDVDVPEARNSKGVDPASTTIITLLNPKEPGGPARVFLNDSMDQPGTLDDAAAAIQEGLDRGITKVLVKAEKEVAHRDVMAVAQMIGETDGTILFLGVQNIP